ncbi:hypothetical protein HanPI659440_Chr08g0301801 [Helianthus annuus]|nr:hypothetical protein HanPI659440_Chr08g0301801 [Helianthus annuus]
MMAIEQTEQPRKTNDGIIIIINDVTIQRSKVRVSTIQIQIDSIQYQFIQVRCHNSSASHFSHGGVWSLRMTIRR